MLAGAEPNKLFELLVDDPKVFAEVVFPVLPNNPVLVLLPKPVLFVFPNSPPEVVFEVVLLFAPKPPKPLLVLLFAVLPNKLPPVVELFAVIPPNEGVLPKPDPPEPNTDANKI